jgi:type I restriction enzyme S subunit
MVSGKMILLRPDTNKITPIVLSGLLATEKSQRYLDSRTTGMADSQLNFTNDLLLALVVDVPPLPEQRKIDRILTRLDNLIEKTEALITKYQAIKKGMMHDLFTRGVAEHGHLRPSHAEAPDLYKLSELGQIPASWCVQSLGQIAEVGNGVTLGRKLMGSQAIELPYLRVANVQDGFLDLSD